MGYSRSEQARCVLQIYFYLSFFFFANFELLSSEFCPFFPKCVVVTHLPLKLKSSKLVSCFGVSPSDVFLKTHLVLFSKQGSIRYILKKNKLFFALCRRFSLVWFSLWSFQLLLVLFILRCWTCLLFLLLPRLFTCPRALNVKKKKLKRRTKSRFFMAYSIYLVYMQKKRKPKRKRPWFLRDSLYPWSQLLVADKRFKSKAPKDATVWTYLVEY